MSEAPVLTARGLVVRYGPVEAVRGIDLVVEPGEVVGIIGPDGAGKTSTLRVLGGLLRATDGAVEAFGRPTWRARRALHHRLGYLAQGFALYGDLSVDENIQLFALLRGVRGWRARREKLLDLVDLTRFRGRLAERLSGGMKQRLALASTLVHAPEILLLDEPTTGVDPVTRRELWSLLGALVRDGLTLVVTTPYLDEAERCTRVILMHQGRVLADAPPRQIPEGLPGTLVDVTARPRDRARQALAGLPEVADQTVFGASLHVRVEGADDPLHLVVSTLQTADVEVLQARQERYGLEDAFLYLTRTRTDAAAPDLKEAS
jgi:ABC-2 type transport system ATP-binding protein